jgi:hypothetical protein
LTREQGYKKETIISFNLDMKKREEKRRREETNIYY